MILPDVNFLVYAYHRGAPQHPEARAWWEACLNGRERMGLPWATLFGFLRIMTNRRVLDPPLPPEQAVTRLRSWLARPNSFVVEPGPRHLDLVESLMLEAGAAGSLVTDVHLAALAIENQAELHSNDQDFGRFPGLRWRNPLA